ncbi:hypothetical protein SXIM_21830 [Streptomyces xiamenensis]|uniref:Uncharacterized protein n=2 Tax=Streptomyces TaxID=1883 RepID=A0A0F7FTX9_9ACTN|nr:hypothetical protein [Streptomyces xiamenensis]AKG43567.1 hypothetical protein SXIM_21830 [Streptomyces xiamenensis]
MHAINGGSMREAGRLAVPAAAAAVALLLAGCGGDSGGSADGGGDASGDNGSGGQSGDAAGDTPPGGTGLTAADLEGSWITGYEPDDSFMVVMSGLVSFSDLAEERTCTGAFAAGHLAMEDCRDLGPGAVDLDGGTLTVSWSSGETHVYKRADDFRELENLIPDLSEMPDLEDLDLGPDPDLTPEG